MSHTWLVQLHLARELAKCVW